METSLFRCCLIFLLSCSPFGSCSKNGTIVQNRVASLPPITETGALQQLFVPPSFGGLDVDFYNIFTSFVNQTRSTLPLIANHGNFSLIQLGLLGAVGAMATGLITIIAEAKYFKEQQEELDLHKRIDVDLQNHLAQIPQTLKPYQGNVPYKDNSNLIDNSQQFYGSEVQPSYSSNNYYSDPQSRKKRQVYTPKKNENSTTVVYPVRKRKMKKKITPPPAPQDFQVQQSYSYDLPLDDFNINETSQQGNFPYYSMAKDFANSATTTTTTTTTTTAKPKSSKILTSVQTSGEEKDKDNNSNNNNVFTGSQPQYPDNSYSPEDVYANYYQQLELEKQNYLNAQQYYQQDQQDYKTGTSDQNAPVYKPSSSQKDTNTNYYAQQAATTTKKSVPQQVLYQNPYTQNPSKENNYYANQDYPNKIYFKNESQSVPNWNSNNNNYMIQLYTTVRPSEQQNSNTQTQEQLEQEYYQQVQQQEAYQQNQQVIPDFPPQQQSSQSQQITQQRPSQAQYFQQSSQSQQQTNTVYPPTQVPVQNQQQINAVYPQPQVPAQIYQQQPNAVYPQTQIPVQNYHQQSQVLNPQIQSQNPQQRPQVLNPQIQSQNPQQRPQVLNPQVQSQNPQQRPQVLNPQIQPQNPQQRPQVINPQVQNPQQPPQLAPQGNNIQNSGAYIEEYLQEMHPPQLPQSNYIPNNQQALNRKNYYETPSPPPPRSLYEQQPSRPIRFPYPQPNRNDNAQISPHNRFPQQNPYATNNRYGNVNPNNNKRVPHNNYVHPGRQDATTARSLLSKIFNPFDLQFPSRNKNSNFMKRSFWTPDKS